MKGQGWAIQETRKIYKVQKYFLQTFSLYPGVDSQGLNSKCDGAYVWIHVERASIQNSFPSSNQSSFLRYSLNSALIRLPWRIAGGCCSVALSQERREPNVSLCQQTSNQLRRCYRTWIWMHLQISPTLGIAELHPWKDYREHIDFSLRRMREIVEKKSAREKKGF